VAKVRGACYHRSLCHIDREREAEGAAIEEGLGVFEGQRVLGGAVEEGAQGDIGAQVDEGAGVVVGVGVCFLEPAQLVSPVSVSAQRIGIAMVAITAAATISSFARFLGTHGGR
jgi:hypothetical protein